jgi:hypothetical protein
MASQNVRFNVLSNKGKESIILDSNDMISPMKFKFGEFNIRVKHEKNVKEVSQDVASNFIFKGINLLRKEEKKAKKYINIGSMVVEVG